MEASIIEVIMTLLQYLAQMLLLTMKMRTSGKLKMKSSLKLKTLWVINISGKELMPSLKQEQISKY